MTGHITCYSGSRAWLEGRPDCKFLFLPWQSHFCQPGPMSRGFHNLPQTVPCAGDQLYKHTSLGVCGFFFKPQQTNSCNLCMLDKNKAKQSKKKTLLDHPYVSTVLITLVAFSHLLCVAREGCLAAIVGSSGPSPSQLASLHDFALVT